jgi:hypothetical protein
MCNWGNEPDWSDAATVVEMAYPKPTPGREFALAEIGKIDFTPKSKPKKQKNPYTSDMTRLAKFAQENGLVMLLRKPNQVLVDIDTPFLPGGFDQRLSMVHALAPISGWHINTSRGGNLHVTVDFHQDVRHQDALLFEAILGGDFKRVALGRKSLAENGDQVTSIFFEKPGYKTRYVPYPGEGK